MVQGLALVLALGAARTVPIVSLVPAFGGRALPFPVRLGIGLLLASFSLPQLMAGPAGALLPARGLGGLLLIAARELLTGATVGLVVSFFFRAAEAAGGLADVLRGASFARSSRSRLGSAVEPDRRALSVAVDRDLPGAGWHRALQLRAGAQL